MFLGLVRLSSYLENTAINLMELQIVGNSAVWEFVFEIFLSRFRLRIEHLIFKLKTDSLQYSNVLIPCKTKR